MTVPLASDGRLCCWHQTDMPITLRNDRYRVRSGKHLLVASISDVDPQQTLWRVEWLTGLSSSGL